MGSACCHAKIVKRMPDKRLSFRDTSSGVGEELMREKVEFQLKWEDTHSFHQDTQSVWDLAKNIGIQDINQYYDIDLKSNLRNCSEMQAQNRTKQDLRCEVDRKEQAERRF
jgi:hypothetical protein